MLIIGENHPLRRGYMVTSVGSMTKPQTPSKNEEKEVKDGSSVSIPSLPDTTGNNEPPPQDSRKTKDKGGKS